MILVTIGMSEYNFDRLLSYVDKLISEGIIKEKVIAQIGNSKYSSKNFETFSTIEREEFDRLIDEASFIITHAGTGSVVPAIKKGKKVIIVPRYYKYNEHLDDHQIELRDLFVNSRFALSADSYEELVDSIKKIKIFQPKKFVSNNDKINDIIINFIEEGK